MKSRILFLVPYPSGQAPSQRFRFEQYLPVLKEQKIDYKIKSLLTENAWKKYYTKQKLLIVHYLLLGFLKRIVHIMKMRSYDFIFIHRELYPIGPPIFEFIIAKLCSKKIIYDFDDAIWLEDPDEQGTLSAKIKNKAKVGSICRWSYKVSVGNEYLGNYARKYNNKVIINPTTIDTEQLHNPNKYGNYSPKSNKTPVIGWTGTHSTMQYLTPILPVLDKLRSKYKFEVRIISNKSPNIKMDYIKFIPWNKETEIKDLLSIDIGIMPLSDDMWSKGKCGFKALQYMALEKPAVVSPVGVNSLIVEHGVNGFHCLSNEDWYSKLEELLKDPFMMKKLGTKGREFVKGDYSVNSNTSNFLNLFK